MAKFVYAECFYPDSSNQIISIEAETLEEAKKKIIQKYIKDTTDIYHIFETIYRAFFSLQAILTNHYKALVTN